MYFIAGFDILIFNIKAHPSVLDGVEILRTEKWS
jgi:hypothetical protein